MDLVLVSNGKSPGRLVFQVCLNWKKRQLGLPDAVYLPGLPAARNLFLRDRTGKLQFVIFRLPSHRYPLVALHVESVARGDFRKWRGAENSVLIAIVRRFWTYVRMALPICAMLVSYSAFVRLPAKGQSFVPNFDSQYIDRQPYRLVTQPAESLSSPPSHGMTWTQKLAHMASGRSQVEVGYSYLRQSFPSGDIGQHSYPDLLLRYGVTDRLELRFGWPGYVGNASPTRVSPGWTSAVTNPNIGLLLDLWRQAGVIPQVAVLASAPIPLSGNAFALSSQQPLTELLYGWEIGGDWILTGRSGFAIYNQAGDRYVQFQQSAGIDTMVSDAIGSFVYWDLLVNHGSPFDRPQHMAGAGLSFLLSNHVSLTWRAGFGVNSAAPEFLTDLRFSYRY